MTEKASVRITTSDVKGMTADTSTRETLVLTTAREISDLYHLPFEILAKTMQKMKDFGLLVSSQGSRGGYHLSAKLESATLLEFIESLEGNQSVVTCCDRNYPSGSPCEYETHCDSRSRAMLGHVNSLVNQTLSKILLRDLLQTFAMPLKSSPSPSSIRPSNQENLGIPL